MDDVVATIDSNGLCHIDSPDFLPYNLWLVSGDDVTTRTENLSNFQYWCASRIFPRDRKYAGEMLEAIGADRSSTEKERAQISLLFHCATMTDVFWVREGTEHLRFSQVSLYAHPLSGIFAEVSLLGNVRSLQEMTPLTSMDYAADISTQGAVPKAWIRQGPAFFLLKDSGNRDVDAELLASQIARCFAVDQVLYEPSSYRDTPVTQSRLFTSVSESIVPMEYVEIYAANHDTTRAQMIKRFDLYGYHMMNLVDYLVGNTDRHWGNWGFLIDNRTNLPIRLHPLMDFNKSFLAYDTLEGARCLTTESSMSQMDAAILAVRAVGLNQRNEIDPAWFSDDNVFRMFSRRLQVLRSALSK